MNMTTRTTYKNRPAVIVESKTLRAVFLPENGGKLASLVAINSGKEYMLTYPGDTYTTLTYDGNYVASQCNAFDDMCPTIDPYTPSEGAYQGLEYPDHGEACRIPYAVTTAQTGVTFTAESKRFPITYQKTVTPLPTGEIEMAYAITNRGEEAFPFIWAGHIMLRGEEGMVLRTPFSQNAPTEMMFATKGYDTALLPKDRLTGFVRGKGAAYKFYYTEKIEKGEFSVLYQSGEELCFSYDKEKVPYLGVWLNNGAFQGIYNLAPEPCTLPYDAPHKAAKKGYFGAIPPKETFQFSMRITLKNKGNCNG